MVICLFLLFFGDGLLWNNNGANSDKPQIGIITFVENDARHKSGNNLTWLKTKEQESVRLGDSVYSGNNSQIHLEMKAGNEIDVGENSLISFYDLDNEYLANFMGGNFRLNVNGLLKITINGEIITLQGNNSEIQMFIDKNNNATIKTLKGDVIVKNKNEKLVKEDSKKSVHIGGLSAEPATQFESQSKVYIWHLYDLYEQGELGIVNRSELPKEIRHPINLKWVQASSKNAFVQTSGLSDFIEKQEFLAVSGKLALEFVHPGLNYWRVSTDDGANWSLPQNFMVLSQFKPKAEPKLVTPSIVIPLVGGSTSIELALQNTGETQGYVAEASLSTDFKPQNTRLFWSPDIHPKLSFYKPGTYYYRFRSVSQSQELSDWSETLKLNVFSPDRPLAPILSRLSHHEGHLGSNFQISWRSPGEKTITEFFDQNNNKIGVLSGTQLVWSANLPGIYKVKSYAINKYGQVSPASKTEILKVLPPVALTKQSSDQKKRTPAAVESSNTMKVDPPKIEDFPNEKYKSSHLSTQGFLWTLQSSQQHLQNQSVPISTGIAVDAVAWWNKWGAEGIAKTGVFALNQAGGQTSMKDLEARLHYRLITGFPLGFFRELQATLFSGYEVYQNTGTVYMNQYQMIKFGTALEFPVSNKWSAGGEFVYGLGSDNTTKKEISGNFNYFFSRIWSLGAGYRLNFIQAGSADSAPQGILPYREGYTEGYSVLNYHF